MGEHERTPAPPWPRFWIPLNALWALIPAATVLYWFATRLPGEAWGIGFLLLFILPAWGLAGLVLWAHGYLVRRRSGWPLLVPPSAFLAGVLLLVGTFSLPATVFLPLNVGRAFARLQPGGGREVVPIPSDQYLDGHGRFVREDVERSTPERALLPLGPAIAPWQSSLEVARGIVSLAEGCPAGVDRVLAYPMRDGWWYVFTEY